MKTPYLLILLLTFPFSSKSQNISDYYYEIYQANQLVENGSLDSALLTYERAFEKADYVHTKIIKNLLFISQWFCYC